MPEGMFALTIETGVPRLFVLLAGLISLLGGLGLTITRRFGAKEEIS